MATESYSILAVHFRFGGNNEEVTGKRNSYRKDDLVVLLRRRRCINGKKCKRDERNDEKARKIPGQEK